VVHKEEPLIRRRLGFSALPLDVLIIVA